MRKTPVLLHRFFLRFLCPLVIIGIIFFQTGCSDNVTSSTLPVPDSTQIANIWVELDVKFKSGCTPDVANGALDRIEKVLRDSATALRNGGFPAFQPIIKIDKRLFQQYPAAHIAMGSASRDTAVSNPTCKCINHCGVCFMINNMVNDTTNSSTLCLESINFKE